MTATLIKEAQIDPDGHWDYMTRDRRYHVRWLNHGVGNRWKVYFHATYLDATQTLDEAYAIIEAHRERCCEALIK